jgi:hypothetical protein
MDRTDVLPDRVDDEWGFALAVFDRMKFDENLRDVRSRMSGGRCRCQTMRRWSR